MKKWLSWLIVTILIVALVGCGADTAENTDADKETTGVVISDVADSETSPEDTESPDESILSEESTEITTQEEPVKQTPEEFIENSKSGFDYNSVPAFDGENAYYVVNNHNPYFADTSQQTVSFEKYGERDSLGRCTVVIANVGKDIMPTEDRGSIGSVKPTGWHTVKYDCVDGNYLYNRCHLIGYQLTGENANEDNLITGTRFLNINGMLPFENMVADYVVETNNHVMYRVTPIFVGDELLARGVLMEAYSVEDEGDGICFNVFCYNVQPGVEINYANGKSKLSEDDTLLVLWQEGYLSVYPKLNQRADNASLRRVEASPEDSQAYVINISSGKFHIEGCDSTKGANPWNLKKTFTSREDLIARGYEPCGKCKP
jgi:DNA-entry nuclease